MEHETNDALHDPDHPGSFESMMGGLEVEIKQVNNSVKKSVIIYATTDETSMGGKTRLYEFYRLHDTGEVLLPASVGISRTLYLYLDGRYGVRRHGEKPKTEDDL